MTCRCQTRPTLEAVEDAYIARFGQSAPVWSFLGNPGLVDALLEAMARGVPWTAESLGERLGVPPLRKGACK
jgi:hypothetical protein